MRFRLADLERKQRYKLIAGTIIPRPIALVTTLDAAGICNAAPFSAFNYMSEDPPLIAIGLQVHADGSPHAGQPKHTTLNIQRSGEFVVNIPDAGTLPQMVACAADFPDGVGEPEVVGFTLAPSSSIAVPRLAECPVAFECRQVVMLNFSAFRSVLIGEVLEIHIRDGIVDPGTLDIDLAQFHPVGRLFGSLYCTVAEQISVPIPSYAECVATAPLKAGRT